MRSVAFRGRRRRPPVVRQYAEVDCGPACLLSVLRYWGGDASLAEVRSLVGTDRRGSSMYQLAKGAAEVGLKAQGATGGYEDLAGVTLPVIAHVVRDGGLLHYVVVERVAPDRIWIMDPAVGRQVLSRSEFEQLWMSKAVLLLEPTDRIVRSTQVPWWGWVAHHLKAEQAYLSQSIFLGAIYTSIGLLTALFIQILLDDIIPRRDARMLWIAGSLLLALLLLRAGLGYGRGRLLAALHRRVGGTLNRDLVDHLFDLPLSFFERTRKGDVTVRLQDCLRVQTGAVQILSSGIIDGMLVIGSLVGLALLAPPLTWIAIVALPLYGSLLVWSARELQARQNVALRTFTDAEATYIDSLEGIREILGTGAGAAFADRNHARWRSFLGALEQFEIRQASLGSSAEALGSTVVVGTLIFGASLVMGERLQVGALVGGYTLIALMLPAIARLADAFVSLQTTRVSGARVMDNLHAPSQALDAGAPCTLEHSLVLEDVHFIWPRGIPQLTGINLVLRRGRIVAVTGANGVGKSTLVKLLRREYEPSAGRILVDGRDARTFAPSQFRRRVALVSSEVHLFSGSLLENITLHRPEVTAEHVTRTIRESGLLPFMQRYPEGLAAQIGEEGRRLSAGEQVIVGLIRALVLEPHVLILDEAFAMLDEGTLDLVREVIRRFRARGAVLLISHDPSILTEADEVYRLEDGTLVPSSVPRRERSRALSR